MKNLSESILKKCYYQIKTLKYIKKILTFILERFENLLKSQSLEKFLIYKALKLDQRSIDINNIYEKCEAIFDFINTIKGEVFLKSFKRVLNILESENKLLLKTEVTDVNLNYCSQDTKKIYLILLKGSN